jgi:alginate O-acetyltransferase complex protein AlgI
MLNFTSLLFWAFLLVCLFFYWLKKEKTWQNIILLIGSLIFYASFNPAYVLLLIASIAIDYWISTQMGRTGANTRRLFYFSLAVNLGVWGFFKYAGSLFSLFSSFQNTVTPPFLRSSFSLLLPIGLSFLTLKKIAYMLDLSRGKIQLNPNFVEYACFVAFFPQLIAGPIDRAQKLIPQFQSARKWDGQLFQEAWPLIVTGLFKKIVIANSIAVIVDQVYLSRAPSKLLWIIGTLGFAIQVLADFSGYTDISRGVARLLGFETSINFNAPYLSLNFNDFWNRWHITLSQWLRDYLFFPVRRWLMQHLKNKSNLLPTILPPLVTMLVSGLWHGTGWNFILWGLFHGCVIAVSQLMAKPGTGAKPSVLKVASTWLLTTVLLLFSWALFRTTSLAWLANVLFLSPFLSGSGEFSIFLASFSFIIFYAALYLLEFAIHRWTGKTAMARSVFYAVITLLIFIYSNSISPDFIYTHF